MGADYYVGLALGQGRVATTLAVVERKEELGARDAVTWGRATVVTRTVRLLERMKLGARYPEVVARVAKVAGSLKGRWGEAARVEVVVDATGTGRAVVELLREAVVGCGVRAVVVVAGVGEVAGGEVWRVGKGELSAGLQVMLAKGELGVAEGLEGGLELRREMAKGAEGPLVMAVALAGWGVRRWSPGEMCGRVRLV